MELVDLQPSPQRPFFGGATAGHLATISGTGLSGLSYTVSLGSMGDLEATAIELEPLSMKGALQHRFL
ncbi:MAG: hypothetical protein AAFU71_12740 [Cyanobacteria bacterium J06632_22]